MDIKVKRERSKLICHGCLSVDRKLNRISKEFSELFYKLRNDEATLDHHEIQLCWECLAFLKNLKKYQVKITMAHRLLVQCLQSYLTTDGKSKTVCLSSLKEIHIDKYDAIFNYEEKYNTMECNQFNDELHQFNEKCDQVNETRDQVNETRDQVNDKKCDDMFIDVNVQIKQECDDLNDINDDSYLDYECNDVISVKNEDKNSKYKSKRTSTAIRKYNQRSKYSSYAVVTKRNISDVKHYINNVCLSQKKYESYIYEDRNKTCYDKMPYECNECNVGFNYKLDLLRHKNFNHTEQYSYPYLCLACTTMITSEEHLERHWTTAHTVMLQCTLCTDLKMFRSLGEVKKHLKKIHNKIYTCTKCDAEEFRSFTDFMNHHKNTHENRQTYICDYCRRAFDKKQTIISHINRLHIPAYCDICNRTYSNRKTFTYHNQVTHPELISGETSKELAYCVECNKQYPSVYKYKRHLQLSPRHTPQKKISVPCPDCGKVFTRTNFMRNHFRFAHLKVTKHHCVQCNKYYTTGYGLRKHIERVHEKIAQPKNKICDFCGRGFGTNKILINHRRTHTGERPHKCKFCPAAFAQETAMKTHQKTQHKNVNLELNS